MTALRFHDLTVTRITPEAAGAVAITLAVPADLRAQFDFQRLERDAREEIAHERDTALAARDVARREARRADGLPALHRGLPGCDQGRHRELMKLIEMVSAQIQFGDDRCREPLKEPLAREAPAAVLRAALQRLWKEISEAWAQRQSSS